METSNDVLKKFEETQDPPAQAPKVSDADLADIKAQLGTLASTVNGLAEMQVRIASKTEQPTPAPDTGIELDPDVERIIDAKVSRAVEHAKSETIKQMNASTLQEQMDKKAETEFPWLFNPKHPEYKTEFNALLKQEYNGLIDKKAPDAVYNAASRAQAKLALLGRQADTDELVRDSMVRNGSLQGFSRPTGSKTSELSDVQRHFAAKLGVNEEVYKKLHGEKRRGA